MKLNVIFAFFAILFISSCIKDRTINTYTPPPVNTGGDSIIHYWNFNGVDSPGMFTPTYTRGGGAMLAYSYRNDTVNPGTALNGWGTDTILNVTTGGALRLRNPAVPFYLSLPTTGYKNVVLKYAEIRTSKGSAINWVSYTVDGSHYITTAISSNNQINIDSIDGTNQYELVSLDFSSDTLVNNNPNFKVKIVFSDTAATNTSGNDRFDNISLYGVKK